ncbi:molybdopterin-guanine dinucleotide biosynthesis protein B [Paenibacillus sp. GSMTC-2017]|uniref:molybdopterin-guanine dinucleotide biosynthesis protein B n=1 Tax=Paenibacillus sp. GSMTC-2017 TaxID=2794350 RepID=UPI0018D75654|nr:molybdopterin-guanine dinucleotide biosynthesis protein B [Paenibacillus sp. GSMTC-2017]MBH5317562.1 molybdopterin-guanine dinucleotide biosynthesis protein B [Paenibacillus sp. GSMTC-2017]
MIQSNNNLPLIVQIVGYKNTGKTTMVCRLTTYFKEASYRVGTIKRDAHDFQMDKPGTDTWLHQEAGAHITAISSSKRTAILKQNPDTLEQLISAMQGDVDVILIEGFKEASYPKIIMARNTSDLELLKTLLNPIALAYWPELIPSNNQITKEGDIQDTIPHLPIADHDQIYQIILKNQSTN